MVEFSITREQAYMIERAFESFVRTSSTEIAEGINAFRISIDEAESVLSTLRRYRKSTEIGLEWFQMAYDNAMKEHNPDEEYMDCQRDKIQCTQHTLYMIDVLISTIELAISEYEKEDNPDPGQT